MVKLYNLKENSLEMLSSTSLVGENILENRLQRMISDKIDVLGDDIMVIAEEFKDWNGSRCRIDILAVDEDANLVVIELKRNDEKHMELQAIRYAAMISNMIWDDAIKAFSKYKDQPLDDAASELCAFFGWGDSPEKKEFGKNVRIILASEEFSEEITTSVLWLNDRDLDITCFRLSLHKLDDQLVLSADQIIPLPEAEEYQIDVKKKRREERVSKKDGKDRSLYTIFYEGVPYEEDFKKINIGYYAVKLLESKGLINDEIFNFLQNDKSCGHQLLKTLEEMTDAERRNSKYRFNNDPELHYNGGAYFVARNWGIHNVPAFVRRIEEKFPKIRFEKLENPREIDSGGEMSGLDTPETA